MSGKNFTSVEQELLKEIMLHRRDVRGNKFLKKEVPDEIIEKILLAASLAPSVGFSQPWEFVIVRDNNTKNLIADSFELENKKAEGMFFDEKRAAYAKLKLEGIHETPINIAVFYKPSVKPVLGQTTMKEAGEYSVVCAVQNMWLMARALNIGMGWVSIVDPEAVKEILKSPPENKLIAYLCIGYVKEFLDGPELEKLNWETRKLVSAVVYQNSYPKEK
ncbi:MAG TPA: 5,6-dimethylbenzimidazole synthase [Gammaproteobacteria bacterium]|nr:5,6-dimethylbenzimidazole synthase [Gammaproteobacteria bacterium]|tara:strand:- start:565 stop:1221 length:657 start_codon:yes stop_codon:yes gene_type:complete